MDKLTELALDRIVLSPHNPRRINPSSPEIRGLAESIRNSGLLQPVVCRPQGDQYELLAGARRFHAVQLLGQTSILAIVRKLSDTQAIEVTVLENLQRENLTPLEESRGVYELLRSGKEPELIADSLGKSVKWVHRRASLTKLIPEIVEAVEAPDSEWHKASAAHLELVARLPTCRQAKLLGEVWMLEGSVADMEKELDRENMQLAAARWAMDDATLKAQPSGSTIDACTICQKRSDVAPELFQELNNDPKSGAKCLDPECWNRKAVAFIERKKEELSAAAAGPIVLVHGKDAPYSERQVHTGAIDSYNYAKAKKTDPGAKQALVISGQNAGKTCWITTSKATNLSGAKTSMPSLDMRRKAHVVKAVGKALEEAPVPITQIATMACLAAAFGTKERQDFPRTQEWGMVDNLLESSAEVIIAELWSKVQPVLLKRLRIWNVSECGNQYTEARNVAELLGLNPDALDADAAAALPGKTGKQPSSGKPKTMDVMVGGEVVHTDIPVKRKSRKLQAQ